MIISAVPVRARAPDGFTLDYQVRRDGVMIGNHKVWIHHDGDGLTTVETEIRIMVSLLTITLYEYNVDATEIWRQGRLITFTSSTDDNGDLIVVNARVQGDGLQVEAGENSWTAPASITPSSLWRLEMARGDLLMGVERGDALAVSFDDQGLDSMTLRGSPAILRKIVVSGELERSLWYDEDGMLVHLELIARDGSTIIYELQ